MGWSRESQADGVGQCPRRMKSYKFTISKTWTLEKANTCLHGVFLPKEGLFGCKQGVSRQVLLFLVTRWHTKSKDKALELVPEDVVGARKDKVCVQPASLGLQTSSLHVGPFLEGMPCDPHVVCWCLLTEGMPSTDI